MYFSSFPYQVGLTYFSDKSECLAAFTGHKIRQWPVGMGSTATAAPKENQYVFEKTCEIFIDLKYKGFGSIEYKRHDINGKYYLIEPTAGRINQQEFIATINGMNLPLWYYNDISGSNIEEMSPPEKEIIYIDEPAEIFSASVHIRKKMISFIEYLRSIKKSKRYRYANKNDLGVFLGLLLKSVVWIFKIES